MKGVDSMKGIHEARKNQEIYLDIIEVFEQDCEDTKPEGVEVQWDPYNKRLTVHLTGPKPRIRHWNNVNRKILFMFLDFLSDKSEDSK